MHTAVVVSLIGLGLAGALLLLVGRGLAGSQRALGAALVVVSATVALAFAPAEKPLPEAAAQRPGDATALNSRDEYASSRTCRRCHPGAYATWHDTYHRKMTQAASERSVLAPFDGRTLDWQGREYRVWKEGERFLVDMPAFGKAGAEPDERWRKEVVMTTGSHHLQAYWIPVQEPPSALEKEGQRLYRSFCAECHGETAEGGDAPPLRAVGLVPEDIRSWLKDAELGHPRARDKGKTQAVIPPRRLTAEDHDALVAYLVRIQHDGRLAQFPFVWITEAERWIHEEESFLQPPVAWTDTEPAGDRWGLSCDECHSVGPVYRWRDDQLEAESAAVDLGIACEACHGPGRAHVERHEDPLARYAPQDDDAVLTGARPDDIVHPAELTQTQQLHLCGQCHAEVEAKRDEVRFRPGGDLTEDLHIIRYPEEGGELPDYLAAALEADPGRLVGSFWRDGTVRVAGRDLNGLLVTECTTKGEMTCLSCHQMHGSEPDSQLGPEMGGDEACLQCHEPIRADVEAHTHHPAGSSGSRCYNCHMPYTTYGLLQAIRAHRVDSPDPLRSADTGRPDACTLCHLDKSLGWSEQKLAEWSDRPMRLLPEPEATTPMSVLHLTKGDAVQRAVAAWHLTWEPALKTSGEGWAAPLLGPLLDDDYTAVRYLAARALASQPGFEDLDYDFLGPPEERAAVVAEVAARWRARPAEERARAAALLGTEPGDEKKAVARLAEGRDEREIRINE